MARSYVRELTMIIFGPLVLHRTHAAAKEISGFETLSRKCENVFKNLLNELNNPCRSRRTEIPRPFGPGPRSRTGKTHRTEVN